MQVLSGVTGDRSIPVNSAGSICHSRASTAGRVPVPPGPCGHSPPDPLLGPVFAVRHLAAVADAGLSGKWFAATPFKGHPARMRIRTVRRRDWREYREIRLAALNDAPSAFASTWQEEASLTASQWMERAQRSENGDTLTIVIAADDAGRQVGLAGGFRPGDRGADAELISLWVIPRLPRSQHRPGTGPRRAGVGREPRSQQRRPVGKCGQPACHQPV